MTESVEKSIKGKREESRKKFWLHVFGWIILIFVVAGVTGGWGFWAVLAIGIYKDRKKTASALMVIAGAIVLFSLTNYDSALAGILLFILALGLYMYKEWKTRSIFYMILAGFLFVLLTSSNEKIPTYVESGKKEVRKPEAKPAKQQQKSEEQQKGKKETPLVACYERITRFCDAGEHDFTSHAECLRTLKDGCGRLYSDHSESQPAKKQKERTSSNQQLRVTCYDNAAYTCETIYDFSDCYDHLEAACRNLFPLDND